jgi:hypothetical protein
MQILGCRDCDLLGMHHQAIASVDPRILQLLHVSCVYSLRDHCLDERLVAALQVRSLRIQIHGSGQSARRANWITEPKERHGLHLNG